MVEADEEHVQLEKMAAVSGMVRIKKIESTHASKRGGFNVQRSTSGPSDSSTPEYVVKRETLEIREEGKTGTMPASNNRPRWKLARLYFNVEGEGQVGNEVSGSPKRIGIVEEAEGSRRLGEQKTRAFCSGFVKEGMVQ